MAMVLILVMWGDNDGTDDDDDVDDVDIRPVIWRPFVEIWPLLFSTI